MKLYPLLLGIVVIATTGCSDSTTGPGTRYGVSFKINGSPVPTDQDLLNFSCCRSAGQRVFRLEASDHSPDGFGMIYIYMNSWSGSTRTYTFNAADTLSVGYAVFGPAGRLSELGSEFRTGFGGSGSLSVEVSSCDTKIGEDPFTGIRRNRTYCDVEGTFAFSAANESGDIVHITDGWFRRNSTRVR